jgi:hypothetical protein
MAEGDGIFQQALAWVSEIRVPVVPIVQVVQTVKIFVTVRVAMAENDWNQRDRSRYGG